MADQLKILFPEGDDEGAFIVPALDARSQVLSIKDRSNGIGKPVCKLAPLGSGQLFILVAPDLSVAGIPDGVLQRNILSNQHGQCAMAALSPPRFFAAWRVVAPFSAVSRCRWVLHFALSLIRCLTMHDSTSCPMEDPLYECGRPYHDLSCLFLYCPVAPAEPSILVQENQTVNDIDLTCFETFPIKATTCLQYHSLPVQVT